MRLSGRRHRHAVLLTCLIAGLFPLVGASAITPDNDAIAGAAELPSFPFSLTLDNTLATNETTEPTSCRAWRNLWYKFTPSDYTAISLETSNSDARGRIALFELKDGALQSVACSDSVTVIRHLLRPNATYYIQVGSYYIDEPGSVAFKGTKMSGITGKVTNETGAPAVSECIQSWGGGFTRTDTGGNYTLFLPGGNSYALQFGCSVGRHVREWYNDKPDLTSADRVAVVTGTVVSGIDAVLQRRDLVTGRITGPEGAQAVGCVSAYHANGGYVLRVASDASGNYQLPLDPGDYRVVATDCQIERHQRQWYSGKSSFETADPVLVVSGSDTTGIDLQLLPFPKPVNDDRANATRIDTLPFIETLQIRGASFESGEVSTCSFLNPTTSRSVWYEYTPSTDHSAITFFGAAYGYVELYTRHSDPTGSVSFTSQECLGSSSSLKTMDLRAGVTYVFQVMTYTDTYYADPVIFRLVPVTPPTNDSVESAKEISEFPYSDAVDTRGASAAVDEPIGCGPLDNTVWYRMTATRDGLARLKVRSTSFTATAALYLAGPGGGVLGATSKGCSSSGAVDIAFKQGETYLIQAGAPLINAARGGLMSIDVVEIIPPANDHLASAQSIATIPSKVVGDTTNATRETGEPNPCAAQGPSVWYHLDPTEDMLVVTETTGLDSIVSVYEGTSTTDLKPVDCTESWEIAHSPQAFPLEAGKRYLIQVAGRSGVGSFGLELALAEDHSSETFSGSTPCGVSCPYWDQQKDEDAKYEASCAPTPTSPEGSWDDLEVTVPDMFNEQVPTHLVFKLSPGLDWDSFICRKEAVGGQYFMTHDANQPDDICTLGPLGCKESAVVRVKPGDTLILRAYNWSDTDAAAGGYAFVTQPSQIDGSG